MMRTPSPLCRDSAVFSARRRQAGRYAQVDGVAVLPLPGRVVLVAVVDGDPEVEHGVTGGGDPVGGVIDEVPGEAGMDVHDAFSLFVPGMRCQAIGGAGAAREPSQSLVAVAQGPGPMWRRVHLPSP
jgi:hypothetical protein